ncbi:MAG TPA: DUF4333 domain-containing protein [Solirubrobacteraceae bacterium]|nr:DUF4333 domain-containing protein [Solirubrobacteraceae bacterium]
MAHAGGRRRFPRQAAGGAPLLILGLAAAVAIAGCGSSSEPKLDTARVERAVAASILAQRGLHTTVSCPSEVAIKTGSSFTCDAKLEVGSYPVTVVITNSKGHVRYENRAPLVALNIEKVEHAIAASIAAQRHLKADVSCPQQVLQQSGISFLCTATVDGKSYPFEVTQVGNNGRVKYVGR